MRNTRHRNCCFELFGFDILVDSNLKPWLMEVNVCPSLNSSSPMDVKLKTTLISDTLNLIGIIPYDKKQYEKQQEAEKMAKLTGLTSILVIQRKGSFSLGPLTDIEIPRK
jgi:hypothetical protein